MDPQVRQSVQDLLQSLILTRSVTLVLLDNGKSPWSLLLLLLLLLLLRDDGLFVVAIVGEIVVAVIVDDNNI